MANDEFWMAIDKKQDQKRNMRHMSPVRLSLLFATAAIAIAMVLTPILADRDPSLQQFADGPVMYQNLGVDRISTGSVPQSNSSSLQSGSNARGPVKSYAIRRSITQQSLDEPCIIPKFGPVPDGC